MNTKKAVSIMKKIAIKIRALNIIIFSIIYFMGLNGINEINEMANLVYLHYSFLFSVMIFFLCNGTLFL